MPSANRRPASPCLNEQVQKAQAEVARNVDAERDEVKRTLFKLTTALEQGEAETAALRNQPKRPRSSKYPAGLTDAN